MEEELKRLEDDAPPALGANNDNNIAEGPPHQDRPRRRPRPAGRGADDQPPQIEQAPA